MCSTRIGSRFYMNLVNMPVVPLAAPTIRMGRFARGPQDAISAKSTWASSSVLKLVNFSRSPIVVNCINDCATGRRGGAQPEGEQ